MSEKELIEKIKALRDAAASTARSAADDLKAIIADHERLAAEVEAVKRQLAEAELVINGLHFLGTSTAAENAARSLNEYLEKYGTKKPAPQIVTAVAEKVDWLARSRSWCEDFADDDNGMYQHRCRECRQYFLGHKRRSDQCKRCWIWFAQSVVIERNKALAEIRAMEPKGEEQI